MKISRITMKGRRRNLRFFCALISSLYTHLESLLLALFLERFDRFFHRNVPSPKLFDEWKMRDIVRRTQ